MNNNVTYTMSLAPRDEEVFEKESSAVMALFAEGGATEGAMSRRDMGHGVVYFRVTTNCPLAMGRDILRRYGMVGGLEIHED
jgi:hypothetical protein